MSALSNIAKNTKLHSDSVRAALRAIPTEVALDIPQHQLEDLVLAIHQYGTTCFNEGYEVGKKKNKDG